MYQTVGHQAIDLYAEAMELPLYRRTIQGASLNTARDYRETEGDEVEDLYHLLLTVKVPVCSIHARCGYRGIRRGGVGFALWFEPLSACPTVARLNPHFLCVEKSVC